jgi:hypothetical protein
MLVYSDPLGLHVQVVVLRACPKSGADDRTLVTHIYDGDEGLPDDAPCIYLFYDNHHYQWLLPRSRLTFGVTSAFAEGATSSKEWVLLFPGGTGCASPPHI